MTYESQYWRKNQLDDNTSATAPKTTWHKIGHAELWLGADGVSIKRDNAENMPMTTRNRAKSVEGLKRVRLPILLHGVAVGSIQFQVQIRKINSLDEGSHIKEEIGRQKDLARRQSFLSMRASGKHNEQDLYHAHSSKRSSDIDTLNPKDSYESLLGAVNFEILEHTDEEAHENYSVMDSEDIEVAQANHLHANQVANHKDSTGGTLHTEEVNDKCGDSVGTDFLPPPPSFSESEHRISAMHFHTPPPLDKEDVNVSSLLPPPPLPPSENTLSSLLPPPLPPPPTST